MLPRGSALAPFKTIAFRNLWSATLVSNLGGLVQTVGAGWLMVSITNSHSMVGLVQSATTLPIMIFSLMAGALADNFNRRQIMITAQSLMMLVSILLAFLTFMDWITPWMLIGFTFLIGCGGALYNPPWQATVGDIVPRNDIPAAVTLNSVGFNLMRSVGPAIGGLIVAAWGGAAAFIFNAFSYIPLIGALFFWKPVYQKPALPRERLVGAMSDGLRYVLMSPHLINIMIRSFMFGIGAISILALLPIIAKNMLNGNALSYGSMLGFFGIGAIIAGIFNSRIRAHFRSESIVKIAFIGFAFSCICLSLSTSLIISHIVLLPAGMCWVLALSLFNISVQLSTPRWVVARALALYQTASFGGMAVGSWLWGNIADHYGTMIALIICGLFLLLGAIAGVRFAIHEIGDIDLAPSNLFREPELRLDLKARSGPIMIMIDYNISEENEEAFLIAMEERRRIRLRDGARHWTLMRDLENPELWTESYHMPTWVDYLRHNQRRIKSDVEIIEVLSKLNKNGERPKVHRMIERQAVPPAHELHIKPPHDL
ncbi:MFS transporter [Bartonella sp. HY329]|uniref:MFS transporter n=1 Tax=unclassified Bartonella TaxID=2645622 RepID=UPI0021C8BBE8|nr:MULTISPECIES: MFS transporter [unclassified Bartonella]UXM94931.1 MFS transporter [Bartonella sp. HY329]UXN09254.1 MFS transporter [Bartonella sp. HY328]